MDLSSFQRKVILFLFITVLVGAVLLAKKEPLKKIISDKKLPKIKKLLPASIAPATIDINTADIAGLSKLPGIGPGLARQIIDYRNQHGPFETLGQLQKVPGIGQKRIEAIKNKINIKDDIPEEKTESSTKFNINTATTEQLSSIAGIGPKTAKLIITYREIHGPFNSLDELSNVPRIGKKTTEMLKEYLYVQTPKQSQTTLLKTKTLKAPGNNIITTRKLSHEIDIDITCPHCEKVIWEKGKRRKIYIRCPHCLKPLPKDHYAEKE